MNDIFVEEEDENREGKKNLTSIIWQYSPPLIQNSRCRTEKGIATKFKINTHNREVTHEALKHCMLFIVFILLC